MKLPVPHSHTDQTTTSVSGARAYIKSHRSGFTTGAFVFTGVVALAAGGAAISNSHTSSHVSSSTANPPSASLQVDTQPANNNDPANQAPSHGLSTNVQSTNTNGHVSTEVTVNGQPVEVPQNGTKTVTTPNGTATITTNSSQTTSGSASNLNYSFTSTSVSNDSSD